MLTFLTSLLRRNCWIMGWRPSLVRWPSPISVGGRQSSRCLRSTFRTWTPNTICKKQRCRKRKGSLLYRSIGRQMTKQWRSNLHTSKNNLARQQRSVLTSWLRKTKLNYSRYTLHRFTLQSVEKIYRSCGSFFLLALFDRCKWNTIISTSRIELSS